MAAHNELGEKGEKLAANYLEAEGYTIVARNWRINRAEVDIVAEKAGTLVFVEVKTRSTAYFGPPEVFVTPKKQALLAAAAAAYMHLHGHEWAFRFDVISIVLPKGEAAVLEHFEDAFFPGLH